MSDNHHRLLAVYGRAMQDLERKLTDMRLRDEVGSMDWTQATHQFERLVTGLIDLAGSAADREKDTDVPTTAAYPETLD